MKWKLTVLASVVVAACSMMVSAYTSQDTGMREKVIKFNDEVWGKGNLDYIDKVMDPAFVRFGYTEQGNTVGIPAFKAKVQEIRSAFTDYSLTLVDMMGVGDKATFKWQLRGNYVGPDHKITPGRPVDIMGETVWMFKGDKVVSEVVELNPNEYYRQIQMALPYSEIANRALALSYMYEVLSKGNVSALTELVAVNHVLHDVNNETIKGLDDLREHVLDLRKAFPDLSIAINDVLADGNLVTTRWTITGTHRGEWNGLAPSGRKFEATGMTFMHIKNDKIQETWSIWDSMMIGGTVVKH